jgi:hypothetical protein
MYARDRPTPLPLGRGCADNLLGLHLCPHSIHHAPSLARRATLDADVAPASGGCCGSQAPVATSTELRTVGRPPPDTRFRDRPGARPSRHSAPARQLGHDPYRGASCWSWAPAAMVAIAEMIRRHDRARARQRRCGTGYFLACSKYGLVPEAWSVTSTTRLISETAWVIATSMPWLRVTVAMPQPWHPPPRRR